MPHLHFLNRRGRRREAIARSVGASARPGSPGADQASPSAACQLGAGSIASVSAVRAVLRRPRRQDRRRLCLPNGVARLRLALPVGHLRLAVSIDRLCLSGAPFSAARGVRTGLVASASPAASLAAIHSSLLTVRLIAASLNIPGLLAPASACALARVFTLVFRRGVFRSGVLRAVFTRFCPGGACLSVAAPEQFAHLLRRHALRPEAERGVGDFQRVLTLGDRYRQVRGHAGLEFEFGIP